MDQDPDPWNWTTDDVVEEFCKSRSIWTNGRPNVKLPDPEKLEHALRENEVDGATILEVGHEQLRSDFDIKPLGHRDGLMWGIEQLRQRSTKWKERSQSNALMQPHILISGGQTLSTPLYHWLPKSPLRPTFCESSTAPQISIEDCPHPPITSSTASVIIHDNHKQNREQNLAQPRSGETFVVDEGGRKKRRLLLGGSSVLPTQNSVPEHAPNPICDHIELPSRSSLSGIHSYLRTYLGPTKLTPDTIFFGSGRFGNPINSDWDTRPLAEDGAPVLDFELILRQDRSIPGRQKYVHKLMVNYFNEPIYPEVDLAGRAIRVIYPYPSEPGIPESSRSAMVFQSSNTGITATRERATKFDLKETFTSYDNESDPSNHDWDFLYHWREEKAEELPVYGESETQSEWERCIESMEAEEQADQMEKIEIKTKVLDNDKVIAVIDEEVDRFIQQWTKQKLPLRKNKAWLLWRKSKGLQDRLRQAAGARKHAEMLGNRLDKLRKSILDEVWYNKKRIRELCGNLKETVYQREEERFRASVWLRNEKPPPPTSTIATKKKSRIVHDSDPEAIDLSGSEIFDEPYSHDNFIDIDDIQEMNMTVDMDSPGTPSGSQHSDTPDRAQQNPSDSQVELDGSENGAREIKKPDAHNPRVKSERKSESASKQPSMRLSATNFVDLTLSDEEASEDPRVGIPTSEDRFNDNPLEASPKEVLQWNINELKERDDRKRLIIKLLTTLPQDHYSKLQKYASRSRGLDLVSIIVHAATEIIRQVQQEDHLKEDLVRLYSCWLDCSPDLFKRMKISGFVAFHNPIPNNKAQQILDAYQKGPDDVILFCAFVRDIFEHHVDAIASRAVEGGIDQKMSQGTPHKKRKKFIQESQVGAEKRVKVLQNRREHENRSRIFLNTQSSELAEGEERIVVNVGKQENEDPIYLNSHIAKRIEPHQVEGIRFMWREIVSNNLDEDEMQGCLLAHTMGLGKTMQA
jgi:hypothetical protein